MPAKPPLCRYFAQAVCTAGSECAFRHELPSRGDAVCQFYLAGACAYGKQCRFDHTRPKKALQQAPRAPRAPQQPPTLVEQHQPSTAQQQQQQQQQQQPPPPQPPQQQQLQPPAVPPPPPPAPAWSAASPLAPALARLGLGDDPPPAAPAAAHGAEPRPADENEASEEDADTPAPPPPAPPLPARHRGGADPWASLPPGAGDASGLDAARAARREREAAAAAASAGLECGICFDAVLSKPGPAGERRFGLLSGCSHVFCLGCVRGWRGAEASGPGARQAAAEHARCCPLCRQPSFYVVPSGVWPADEGAKAAVVGAYRAALSRTPCRHFDRGRGVCPFVTSCWYAHVRADGSDAKGDWGERPRLGATPDGGVRVLAPPRLGAWLLGGAEGGGGAA